MTVGAHAHEELATKKDVDTRFDRVEERLDRVEERLDRVEDTLVHLTNSVASTLNVLTSLNERVTALEANQRAMLEILERIEDSTSRQVWILAGAAG